jgi:hypothetical protein
MESKKQHEKQKQYPWHGFLGNRSWAPPVKTQHCDVEARPGYQSEKAHEYEDEEDVLWEKVQLLADLIKKSRHCLIYSGAGLSTSSGISDYATKSNTKFAPAKKKSGYAAQPTFAHRALVAMQQQGLIQHWVQQNHDGLPQKAGLPQHALNEIHGAWYDPSNPVVPMSGSLRGDLFQDLLLWEQRTDLTISVGTSMCGMNSDRVFTTVSKKSIGDLKKRGGAGEAEEGGGCVSLGGVIIGIQKTQYDSLACLHLFSRIDRVFDLLLLALEIDPPPCVVYSPDIPRECQLGPGRFLVRYDSKGQRLSRSSSSSDEDSPAGCTLLDLREGSRVMMVSGPYKGDRGVVTGRLAEEEGGGHYRLEFTHTLDYRHQCEAVPPYRMTHILGSWYVEAAVKGTLSEIPIVNC